MREFRLLVLLLAVGLCLAGSCSDEPSKEPPAGADYTLCNDAPQNNPMVVCNSMIEAVEGLCGFSLTVDPCECYDEVSPCAVSSEGISEVVMAFLEGIIACSESSSDCTTYINCLEALGEVDNCSNPAEWSCVVTTEGSGEE